MRLVAIALVVVLGGLVQAGLAAARPNALEAALGHEINRERSERALRPLAVSAKLAASAADHTREMGAQGYFEHDSRDARPFWKRIQEWYPSRGQRFWAVGETSTEGARTSPHSRRSRVGWRRVPIV